MEGDRGETDLYILRWKKIRPQYEMAKNIKLRDGRRYGLSTSRNIKLQQKKPRNGRR